MGGQDSFQFATRFLMLATMALGALSLLFCQPKRRIIPTWPLWLLLFFIAKLYYLPYQPLSMHAVFCVFFSLGLFYLVLNYAEDMRWLYRAIAIVLAVNTLYVVSQFLGWSPIFTSQGLPSGFFPTNSDLAGYLILVTPLMAHYAKGFGFLPPFILALSMQSMTAISCNFISGILFTARKGFYPMMTLVIIALSLAMIVKIQYPYNFLYKLKYRAEIWKAVAEAGLKRPMVGHGLGTAVNLTTKTGQGAFTAKSEPLEFALEVGAIPAVLIFGFIFYTLFTRHVQAGKSWDLTFISLSLLAFSIACMTQSHLRNPRISPTVMAVLGFYYILTERRK